MPNHILLDLQTDGHLTQVDRLLARGHSRRGISRAVERGEVLRICRGWVATRDASQLSIVAVVNRGILTGATSMATLGIWDAVDRRIHLQVPANSHGPIQGLTTPIAKFVAPRHTPGKLVRHWTAPRCPDRTTPPWRASVLDSLVIVARCSLAEQFIACVDSALNKQLLSRAGIPHLMRALPQRLGGIESEFDATAESGLESLARVRLRPLVRRVQTQVAIPGIAPGGDVGRIDILIDGWLVIELDGDEFHDPRFDRERNAILVRLGYRVHRFGYDQVIFRWPEVEATILELLRYPPVR
jgi:very-short-patch-repair endonuclease